MKSKAFRYLITTLFILAVFNNADAQPPTSPSISSDLLRELFSGSLQDFQILDCETSGCDRQIVDPDGAIDAFGGYTDGSGWVERVRADPSYRTEDDNLGDDELTCSRAIKALLKFTCDGDNNCALEEEYRKKCNSSQMAHSTAKKCVDLVDVFREQCMGDGCSSKLFEQFEEPSFISAGIRRREFSEPFCTVASVRIDPDEYGNAIAPVIVSAPHCQEFIERFETVIGRRWQQSRVGEIVAETDRNGERMKFYNDTLKPNMTIPVGEPKLFGVTVFRGFNFLIHQRNVVSSFVGYDPDGRRKSPLYCDSSQLCTIVEVSGDRIKHTCQSTKGGSGGVLIQDGRIVAINDGAPDGGLVKFNYGIKLWKSNLFADPE